MRSHATDRHATGTVGYPGRSAGSSLLTALCRRDRPRRRKGYSGGCERRNQNPYTVNVKAVLPVAPPVSVAVTLTVKVPAAVGVPVMSP